MEDDGGNYTGDICGRNGCKGIIKEIDSDSCCSCHISPPCKHCVEMDFYCPECGWESDNSQSVIDS